MNEVLEKTLQVPFSEVSHRIGFARRRFVRQYRSPEKAFALLRESIERSPRSIRCARRCVIFAFRRKNLNEAARHCLALVSLYIGREISIWRMTASGS
jgi:hypothetical protein